MNQETVIASIEKVFDDRERLFAELAAENIDEALKNIRILRSNIIELCKMANGER